MIQIVVCDNAGPLRVSRDVEAALLSSAECVAPACYRRTAYVQLCAEVCWMNRDLSTNEYLIVDADFSASCSMFNQPYI